MGNAKLYAKSAFKSNKKIPSYLRIKTYTWTKQSSGLFDYGFRDINSNVFDIKNPN